MYYDETNLPVEFWELANYYGAHNVCVLTQSAPRGTGMGRYTPRNDTVYIYAHKIWWSAMRATSPLVEAWLQLVATLIHEIEHQNQRWNEPDRFFATNKHIRYLDRWGERGARAREDKEILRLATLDEYMFMPERWRGYFGARGGRLQGWLADSVRNNESNKWRALVRLYAMMERAGEHVPYGSSLAKHCEGKLLIHRTPSGRKFRFLTPAQTVWNRFLQTGSPV